MKRSLSRRGGFNLIEVVIAVAISSFVLVGLIGLIGVAQNAGGESAKQMEAASVASQLVNQWRARAEWNSSATNPAQAPTRFPLSADVPDAAAARAGAFAKTGSNYIDSEGMTVDSAAQAEFFLSYTMSCPSNFPQALQMRLQLSWPPQATASNASRYDVVSTALLRE